MQSPISPRARSSSLTILLALTCLQFANTARSEEPALGAFESQTDIGQVSPPGSATFDKTKNQYRITSAGQNIWKDHDDFHFLHRKASGDIVLTAEITLEAEGKNPHRKAGLMIRQSLDPDAPYVDVMLHGDGLIALQYRPTKGAQTADVKAKIKAPATLRLERHGETFSLSLAPKPEKPGAQPPEFQPAATIKVSLTDPVLIGLAVCSHDDKATETAVFSNVSVKNESAKTPKDERK